MAFHRTHNNLNMEGESPMKSPTKSFLLVVSTSAGLSNYARSTTFATNLLQRVEGVPCQVGG